MLDLKKQWYLIKELVQKKNIEQTKQISSEMLDDLVNMIPEELKK